MEDNTTTPAESRLTNRLAIGIKSLGDDLRELKKTLSTLRMSGMSEFDDSPDEVTDYIRATITIIDAEFQYVATIIDEVPADAVDVSFASSHIDGPSDGLKQAHEQFTEVVAPVQDELGNGEFTASEWREFWGAGHGLSHSRTVRKLVNELNPPEHTGQTADRNTEPLRDIAESAATSKEETEVQSEDETTESEQSDGEEAEQSDGEKSEYAEPVEYLTDPAGNEEPLGHDRRIANGATITDVQRTGLPDPPNCKTGSQNGTFLLSWSTSNGDAYVSRLCSSCLPNRAKGIAPGFRLHQRGRENDEEPFVYVETSTSGKTWNERHGIGTTSGQNQFVATVKYELEGDTLRMTTFDSVSEHGREGISSVEIDEWDGAIPVIEGQHIGDWLTEQANQHYEQIHNNEGVDRHIVPIDEDQSVISRARKAYRQQNPDFEHPTGMINDYTPVIDDYIPVCAECGTIVAGISPEDAEACETCGCTDAEWNVDDQSTSTDGQPA